MKQQRQKSTEKKAFFLTLAILMTGVYGYAQGWSIGTGILYTNPLTTKVGVGISSPTELLQINGGAFIHGGEKEVETMLWEKLQQLQQKVNKKGREE